MDLSVERADIDEIFTDMVRIPEKFRQGIENGAVVRIEANGNRAYAIVRGLGDRSDPVIVMDEFVRRKLKVNPGAKISSGGIRAANAWAKLQWYLEATNPAIYVPAWVAAISLGLGVLSVLLGIWGIVIAVCATNAG